MLTSSCVVCRYPLPPAASLLRRCRNGVCLGGRHINCGVLRRAARDVRHAPRRPLLGRLRTRLGWCVCCWPLATLHCRAGCLHIWHISRDAARNSVGGCRENIHLCPAEHSLMWLFATALLVLGTYLLVCHDSEQLCHGHCPSIGYGTHCGGCRLDARHLRAGASTRHSCVPPFAAHRWLGCVACSQDRW